MASDPTTRAIAQAARRGVSSRRGRRRASDPAGAPRHLVARALSAETVELTWHPPRPVRTAHHRRPARPHVYRIFRDGRVIGRAHTTRFFDTRALPGTHYRYTVKAYPRHGTASRACLPAAVRTGVTLCTPAQLRRGIPAIGLGTAMTQEMVDRVLWRAGFGASDADRRTWLGRPVGQLLQWLLSTPQSYRPTNTVPLADSGAVIDPLVTNAELVLEWVDRMQRAVNPLTERLTFFWHRHWAVSRNDGVPAAFLVAYRNRLQRYGDLAANPGASFRTLAVEMTTQDAAMSLFLNQNQNVRAHPNENYAREFMELFCLGVTDDAGQPNYSQTDVQQLARAFTGWRLDKNAGSPTYGQVTFNPSAYDGGVKAVLGRAGAFDAPGAVDVVLSHPSHAPHLINKLWAEFIATPIPPATLAGLTAAYTAGGGLCLAPVLAGILGHPLLFESLCEPNLVKPPIVAAVGALRALDVPLKGSAIPQALANMQQLPYSPPNVAGWEGGMSWLNSGTAEARFDLIVRGQNLRWGGYPGTAPVADVPRESGDQALARAWADSGSPWLSPATQSTLLAYARSAPAGSPSQRRQRYYALQASLMGGPDGQVM